MSCQSHNATPAAPSVAPGSGGRPGAHTLDPGAIAASLVERHGPTAMRAAVSAAVPGFDAPFFQAGLAGYSDAAMRIVARRQGCPYCVTEALLDRTLLAGGRGFAKADLGDIAENVPGGSEDTPLAGQIMGSEPAEMAAAAVKMIEQATRAAGEYRRQAAGGALGGDAVRARAAEATFAAIDVNLACPVKKIARKARGGHWLAEPDGAIAILQAVRDAVPAETPVTVKLRRAFDDTEAMRENFYRILDAAYDMGCAFATVHGRTVRQKYVGPSRWDLLREIVDHNREVSRLTGKPQRVMFGSGDVWSEADVFRMIAYTGVDGASVARGCIGDPWVFRRCRDLLAGRTPRRPTIEEQRGVLEQHFELALAANHRFRHPEFHTGKTMRKFGIKFAEHHPDPGTVKRAFVGVSSIDDWRGVLDAYYAAEPARAG